METRELKAPCGQGQHHEDAFVRSAKELQDCSFVLVARIGPGADKVLASHGIKAFEIYDRIDRAIDKLIKYVNGTTKR
ncbi:Dinitrogenase iron-molybdenum cofactor [compost metagenome]